MKRLGFLLILVAVGGAYLAGYWPEHALRIETERSSESLRVALERAAARNRLCGLQSQLVDLLAVVEARNFGEAQAKTTAFFDAVRAEAGRSQPGDVARALDQILAQRDAVTIGLTQNDPATLEMLRGALARLRAGLSPELPVTGAAGSPSPPTPQ